MQHKIQEDLYIQQRSVKMWCEAMLNLDRMLDSVAITISRSLLQVRK